MIRKMIEEIIEKYYFENSKCYSRYRKVGRESKENYEIFKTTGKYAYLAIDEEIKSALEEKEIRFKIEFKEGYESSFYENDFLAVAWVEADGTLELETVLLEIK